MSKWTVLVVDEKGDPLSAALKCRGCSVTSALSGREALSSLQTLPDIAFVELSLPDMKGLDLVQELRRLAPTLPVVVTAREGTAYHAIDAVRRGAIDYIEKPFPESKIDLLLQKLTPTSSTIIAESPAMNQVVKQAQQMAKTHESVFITGESGTGKEIIAGLIHKASPRSLHPYICINCAAIPDTLVESEFFGHEKGAFTGAAGKKAGRFELAHKGTLLLDEITEIPPHLQPKLLRAIQEQTFERVGGTAPINVDIRFVATSNRPLQEALDQGQLRDDLYYRLNVLPLHIPPLRDRPEDIVPLARHFLAQTCQQNNLEKELSSQAEEELLAHAWPGNARELANAIARAAILTDGPTLTNFS